MNYVVPSVCSLALLFGGFITINPTSSINKTYAEELDFITEDIANVESSDIMLAAGNSTISLDIAGAANGVPTMVPTTGVVTYRENTLTVGGSGVSTYYITLSSPNGSAGNLVGKTHSNATVGKVKSGTLPTNFGDNTWGYAVSHNADNKGNDELSYNPMPSGNDESNASVIASKTGLSGNINDEYRLVFAAKFGSNMPADNYQANVYVSLVSSAASTVENWFYDMGVTTMQGMSSIICAAAPENATAQLTDTRDGKSYWVAKLKDNHCWMTQNLDYDDPNSTAITSPANWSSTNTARLYYNPGDFYYSGSNGDHAQGTSCTNDTGLNACTGLSTMGDAHYHVGNYYSWNSATNGTGAESRYTQASDSICPTGWRLPIDETVAVSKSLGHLLAQYGVQRNIIDGDYAIYKEPLYFVYGGYLGSNKLQAAGTNGYYWTSSPVISSNGTGNSTYYLQFSSSVSPSSGSTNNRSLGYSVRCVAQ